MRSPTAAVATTAAVLLALVGSAISAGVHTAVRAEVVIAREGHLLDVRQIRIIDGLTPGMSYRLPAFGIRNHRGTRTAYRFHAFAGAAQSERRPPRRWLRFAPGAVVIDAGRSRAVGVRLELPHDAASGVYAVVLGVRPGGSEGARLTFRVEPAERTRFWLPEAESLAMLVGAALVGAVLILLVVRRQRTGNKRLKSLGSTMWVREDR